MKKLGRIAAAIGLVGTLSLAACGATGGLGGLANQATPKEDTGKPLVEEARNYLAELKGEYVVTMGIVDEATALVEELATIPEGVNLKQLKLNELTSSLKECWETPVAKATEIQDAGLDLADAAAHFQKKEGLRSLSQTQKAVKAAYANVTTCTPNSIAKAKMLPKNANDVTKAFIDTKVGQVDSLRKLIKHEAPTRAEGLLKKAAEIVPKFAEIAAKLEAQAKNPLTDQGLFQGHMSEFTKLKAEAEGMVSKLTTDAKDTSNKLAQMPEKVTKAFAFKK